MVHTSLLSGLECFVLQKGDYEKLDKVLLKFARKLTCGETGAKSTDDNGVLHYKAVPNKHVCRYVRLVPGKDELLVRRLRWCQQLARRPDLQTIWFACLFGSFEFEQMLTLQHDGSIHVKANPWAQQFANDILVQLSQFHFWRINPCGSLQTSGMNFGGWMFLPFGRSILQVQYLRLNMFRSPMLPRTKRKVTFRRMSQFSDVIVYVRMVGPAQLSSKRGSSCPSMFAQQKGAHMQRCRVTESWPSRINALFVASFSVVNVQPNSTSDDPSTSKCARAVAVLLCLSLKFLVPSSVRTVLLSLPRCLSCGTMCRNMCQGPGSQKQDNSLSFSSMDAWELGPQPSEKQPQKRVAIGADKELAKAVRLIARLCLKNSLEVRELHAACFVTFIVPKASHYVQAMLGAAKQYADKAKGKV